MEHTSIDIGRAAIRMALSESRQDEQQFKKQLEEKGIRAVAVDFGGQFLQLIPKIIENTTVAAQRQHVIFDSHVGKGAVVGAVQEALDQLKLKAIGLNVGGKVGIARYREHLSVAIYMGVGVLNLNEISVAVAHRSLPLHEERVEG